MNVQQLKYIISVSETLSFGKAAKKCFVTQPTLSTMVARFEDEIGIIIFDRKTKPITITQEGENIVKQLKVVTKELDNLEEIVNGLKGIISGTLKIGVIPTVAPFLLPLFLNDFIQKNPKVHFEISEITTEKIISELQHRTLDIGILSTPLDHPDLIEIPLYNEPFLLFDRADKISRVVKDINAIDGNRLWLLDEGHCMRAQVETICSLKKKSAINSNMEYKTGTIDTLLRFVKKNNGVTLLPYLSTIDFLAEDKVFLKSFKAPVPARTISLVVHKHFVKKKILEQLKEEVIKCVNSILKKKSGKELLISPVG
jgi:LysR family transcriptional regulator, hydrogen peroxide-inducible genes activator